MTPTTIATSAQRILTKSHIACRAVIKDWMIPSVDGYYIDDWMIPFAVYTAAETPNAFQ